MMDPPDPLTDPAARRRARRDSYALLARLTLAEPDAALIRYLGDLPGFADALPADAGTPAGLDALAAAYQDLCGANVYPYEAIFRDPDLLLNTAATERVVRFYDEVGFAPRARVGAPDHLGLELRLMADLIAAEETALAQGFPAAAEHARGTSTWPAGHRSARRPWRAWPGSRSIACWES